MNIKHVYDMRRHDTTRHDRGRGRGRGRGRARHGTARHDTTLSIYIYDFVSPSIFYNLFPKLTVVLFFCWQTDKSINWNSHDSILLYYKIFPFPISTFKHTWFSGMVDRRLSTNFILCGCKEEILLFALNRHTTCTYSSIFQEVVGR